MYLLFICTIRTYCTYTFFIFLIESSAKCPECRDVACVTGDLCVFVCVCMGLYVCVCVCDWQCVCVRACFYRGLRTVLKECSEVKVQVSHAPTNTHAHTKAHTSRHTHRHFIFNNLSPGPEESGVAEPASVSVGINVQLLF